MLSQNVDIRRWPRNPLKVRHGSETRKKDLTKGNSYSWNRE